MKVREPLTDLAAILGAINAASQERARLADLLGILSTNELFDSVAALGAKDGSRMYYTFDVRGDRDRSGGWQKWPLRRLFDSMRLRRIVHPHREGSALAIPLDYGLERCVLIAGLSDWAHGPESRPFFNTLENFTVSRCRLAIVTPNGIPVSPVEPTILTLALCPQLNDTLGAMLVRRGWSHNVARNFFELNDMIQDRRPDAVLLDFDHELDPQGLLLRIHAQISEEKVLAFGEEVHRDFERQALIDLLIPHDAPEPEVFAALKRFARQVPELRKTRMRSMSAGFERALLESSTPKELSIAGARHAAEVMSGWAAVHLVSEAGDTFSSEYPRQDEAVMTALPKTFLSDAPFFQLRADDRFFEEVSDDRRVVGALERLHPVSGASIPLLIAERRMGTLVSVSRGVTVDSSAFEELDGFSKLLSRRFEDFASSGSADPIVERNGVWECVRHGCFEFAAYRSGDSSVIWDYRAIRSDLGILVVGDDIELPLLNPLEPKARIVEALTRFVDERASKRRIFLAACDPVASTVSYAADGFPAPMLFDAPGPAGTLSARGSAVRGAVAIVPPAGLIVWDTPLHRWLVRENVEAHSVTETLEDLRPPGLAIIVTRSGQH